MDDSGANFVANFRQTAEIAQGKLVGQWPLPLSGGVCARSRNPVFAIDGHLKETGLGSCGGSV